MSSKTAYNFVLECLNTPGEIVLDKPEQNYTCGRGKQNHIVCLGLTVSRKHCIFVRSKDELYVSDLKSSNGIFINGIKQIPHNMVKLNEDDIIGIGCDLSSINDKNMFAYKLRIIKQDIKTEEMDCSTLSKTIPNVNKALEYDNLDNENSSVSKRANEGNCNVGMPSKIRKVGDSDHCRVKCSGGKFQASHSKNDTKGERNDEDTGDVIIINENNSISEKRKSISIAQINVSPVASNKKVNITEKIDDSFQLQNHLLDRTNLRTKSKMHDTDSCPNDSSSVPYDTILLKGRVDTRKNSTTLISKFNERLSAAGLSPVTSDDRIEIQTATPDIQSRASLTESTSNTSKMNLSHPTTPILSKKILHQNRDDADSSYIIRISTPKVNNDTSRDAWNLQENFIISGGTVIKMEHELQLTDNEENELFNSVSKSSRPAVSPIKLKKINQEPKTMFSVVDIVNLSDSEDDIFPCSQLFDNGFDTKPDIKVEVKQEVNDDAFCPIAESDEIILLSDSEDEENPWLERLSRSQVLDDIDDDIKSIHGREYSIMTSEARIPKPLRSAFGEPNINAKELSESCETPQPEKQRVPASPHVSADATLLINESASPNTCATISPIRNTSLGRQLARVIAENVTVTDTSAQTSGRDDSVISNQNKSTILEPKANLSERKPPQVIDPPYLIRGRRKKKSLTDSLISTPSKKQTIERLTEERKELEEKRRKIEHYMRKREQRHRRITHKWAECLPVGKLKGNSFSKEEKKKLANERKPKLKKLAEDKEKEVLPENERTVKRPIAKPKVKISMKNRGDFLLDERQNTSTSKSIVDKLSTRSEISERSRNKRSEVIATVSAKTNNEATVNSETVLSNRTQDLEHTLKSNDAVTPSDVPNATELVEQCSTHSQMSTQNENCSPNRLREKVPTLVKKRVSFHTKIVTIHEFEIDPQNSLKKLNAKDAPIPRDKLRKRPLNNFATCPKIEEFLLRIFEWNPVWLEEQRFLKTTAPVVKESEIRPMLSHYVSFDEYYNIALPLLLLETWCNITKDFETRNNTLKRPTMMCSVVENSISVSTVPSTQLRISTLLLEVLVTKCDLHRQCHPNYGDLVFFEYVKNEGGKQTFHKVFAYITSVHQTILTPNTYFNKDLRHYVKDPYALLTYTIMTKVLENNIPTNRVQRLRTVTYLRASMRMVQALQYLPVSPLINLILNPVPDAYQLPTLTEEHRDTLVISDNLNSKQMEAVLKVTECVVRQEPKLCFIHGPPGTGKSKVIVNIVMQTLYGGNRYKNSKTSLRILVCAPSNAAIDEIVVRLLAIRSTLSDNRFKMVRLGRPETMHPSAKHISVTELAKRDVKRITSSYSSNAVSDDNVREEKLYLEAQINALKCEISTSQSVDETYKKHLKRKLADMTVKYELLQNRKAIGQMDPKDLQKLQRAAENRVLLGADIITCTLSSCYTNQMESLFGGNRERISVCIVDEATQSCEAETLIPLMLGVNTLVLVGDPNQLPATVLSQRAKKLGLDQSLFSRIQKSFELTPNNPVIMLDVQYRMACAVSYWPNKYFYGGKLKNGITSASRFPYHSYRVLNLDSNQNDDKFSNTNEAEFISNVIFCIMTSEKLRFWKTHITIGILTPYNNQRTLMLSKINEQSSILPDSVRKNFTVEVNTVDSFQGQERDIIVMSCVRSHGIGFLSDRQRLCVALTRAKHSLILCGNFNTFMRDQMWNALLSDAKWRHVFFNVPAKALLAEIKPLIVK